MREPKYFYLALISGVMGVSAAAGTVVLMGRSEGDLEAVQSAGLTVSKEDRPERRSSITVLRSDSEKLRNLEARIDGLQEALDEKDARAADPPARRDRGQRLLEYREKAAELERNHQSDPPDPAWAGPAEQDLTNGLNALGEELGFDIRSSECRTTSCRAEVHWDSVNAADRGATQLAERAIPGLNCEQTVLKKDPSSSDDSDASDVTTLYLDCTEQRAGLVAAFEQ